VSSKHKHDSHGKKAVLELDEKRHLLYVNGNKYEWEWGDWVTADVSGQVSHEGKNEWCRIHSNGKREDITSDEKKTLLDRRLRRAKREKDQRLEATRTAVLAAEEARNPSPPAERQIASEDKPEKKAPVVSSTDDEIKRDKHGIKLWSHGGNYSLSVCVNNSMKYPGEHSVSLFVAGKRWTYTLGKKEMRALMREVARAFSAKELRELLLEGLRR
jgi:hypothetical protein